MPEITSPGGLPVPQEGPVSPEESRMLTENGGPRRARALQLDERQVQRLSWALDTAKSAIFKTWWREELIYGGAWFSAPATWPTPEGLVVKVRRFIGAPDWSYVGNGLWRVSCDFEVRGSTLVPQTPPEPDPPATSHLILIDPRAPASLVYGAAYLADFPGAQAFDAVAPGVTSIGSAGEIVTEGGIAGAAFADALTAEGAGRSNTQDTSGVDRVAEFHIEELPSTGAKVAVGVFSPSYGPPGNLESYLLGSFSSLATYWTSDGLAFGYGGSEDAAPTFQQGDVIGIVIEAGVGEVHFYLNGDPTGVVKLISDINLYLFASVVPVEED